MLGGRAEINDFHALCGIIANDIIGKKIHGAEMAISGNIAPINGLRYAGSCGVHHGSGNVAPGVGDCEKTCLGHRHCGDKVVKRDMHRSMLGEMVLLYYRINAFN